MTAFREQDLSGTTFRRVSLRGARFHEVRLNDAELRDVDLTGLQVRAALLAGSRWRGVELTDVEISGELHRVVVNGVDIAPLVEAELDRRLPERAAMRPETSEGFREAWTILERLWDSTVAHARTFPEADLHRSVDGEWSFIETLRHLGFATASWVGRIVRQDPSPWHPLDLPWDEAPGWEGVPWDRDARPSLDEALEVRHARQRLVREVLASLTDDRLAERLSSQAPGGVQEEVTVAECLRVVLNEEWEHRLYAERDLTVLEQEG